MNTWLTKLDILRKISFDEIADAIGLSVEKIKELAKMQPARP